MRRGNFQEGSPESEHLPLTERRLNPYSRVVAALAAAVGVVGGLVTLDWRWAAGGVVVAILTVVAGPWYDYRPPTEVSVDPDFDPRKDWTP